MKIISFWNPKGGVGRTTLAVNLAAMYQHAGQRVLLIDLDNPGTASWMSGMGRLTFPVSREMPPSKPNDVDLLIVDYPAAYSRLPVGRRIVVPFKPVGTDYVRTMQAVACLGELDGKQIFPVLTEVDMRRSTDRQICAELQERYQHNLTIMRQRNLYRALNGAGETLCHHFDNPDKSVKAACEELKHLMRRLD